MNYIQIIAMIVGVCSFNSRVFADETTGFPHTLFDGETRHGWLIDGECEVDVLDGCLRLKSGKGRLRHETRLKDFELHLEWKALKPSQYDAGVYFRSPDQSISPRENGYHLSLHQGHEGDIPTLKSAESRGLVNPAGEWNEFDLRVIGESAALKINGKSAWNVSGLTGRDGWLGFEMDVPKGGQFYFRNITVVELGYRSLFNGRDFAGWESANGAAEECWSVNEGLLVCSGKKGPWLRSVAEFDDFNLRLDYRVSNGGNSGVYIRVPKDGNHHRDDETQPSAGFEVQILDDTAPEHAALKDFQYSASIYDFVGAKPHVSRSLGEWNSLEINCRGQHITTWHNGVRVADATAAEIPLLGLRQTKGFLGLQNHSTVVAFRNIRWGTAVDVPASHPRSD